MNWIEERIRAEKRKHEKWSGDEWIKIAALKIQGQVDEILRGKDEL